MADHGQFAARSGLTARFFLWRSHAQIRRAHLFVVDQFAPAAVQGDAAGFQHIAPIGQRQRRKRILLGQNQRHALGFQGFHHIEDFFHQ